MNRLVELVFGPLLTVHQWLYEQSDGRIDGDAYVVIASNHGRPHLARAIVAGAVCQPPPVSLLTGAPRGGSSGRTIILRIRREQMEVLQRAARVPFAKKVVAYLQKNAAEVTERKKNEDLLEFVQECIDAAASQGVTSEWDVCRYAQHRCVLGDDFATSDWAAPIFSDPALDGSEKMDRVEFLALHVVGTDGKQQEP